MPFEITMPQQTDTMTEGTVIKWNRKEGEKVKAGEEIAEIETDKATMPMESFQAGTLAFVAAAEGQKVKVGGVMGVIALANENPADVKKQYASKAAAPSAATQQQAAPPKQAAQGSSAATTSGGGTAVAAPPRIESAAPAAQASGGNGGNGQQNGRQNGGQPPLAPHSAGGRIKISPLASRIAADMGVDIASLAGSGPGGRIIQKDVLAAASAPKPAPSAAGAPSGPGGKTVTTMSKMRTAIATALQRSKQMVPHFYETIDIDVEQAVQMRERLNTMLEKEKVRLSLGDFGYKAIAKALQKHPILNSRFNAEKGEITTYSDINLGIAVAIPDGLIVPVLRNIERMDLRELRTKSVDLIERARAQRLKREESTEATFTVSSLGPQGIREFSAIINPPEVAILAIGAAEKRAVVRGDQIVARTIMTVTLSADHRVIDGAVAAGFLATFKAMLEEPGMLLV